MRVPPVPLKSDVQAKLVIVECVLVVSSSKLGSSSFFFFLLSSAFTSVIL